MAKQTINQGTAPTGAGGDTFRSGSAKLQANDNELYTALGANASGVLPAALPVNKGGTGAATAAEARINLGLGTAATATLTTDHGDNTSNRVTRVGDFGVGLSAYDIRRVDISSPQNVFGFGIRCGLVDGSQVGASSKYASAIILASWHDSTAAGAMPNILFFDGGHLKGRYATSSTTWENYIFRTSRNTTVDSNGFIKNASPIVQLFADKIELNDEAKEQSIEFEKLGVGDYLIKGSIGFAQEGWYVETPKDANGNLLVAVVYEQLENGDISVKTYDYMLNKKGRIVADIETPLDIPENRWIDIRLQELPQPEIEVTDDPKQ